MRVPSRRLDIKGTNIRTVTIDAARAGGTARRAHRPQRRTARGEAGRLPGLIMRISAKAPPQLVDVALDAAKDDVLRASGL